MNKAVWIVVVLVVLGGIAWVVQKGAGPATLETGPIKIGVMVPLTGDGAVYGEPARTIYEIAAKEINDAGGINGRPIELVIEDSKCNGKDGANAAQKLVNVDKVQIIIGGFCSSESLASIPVVEQAKVALFSPGSSSPDLTGKSPFFARNYPGDSAQGKVLADVAYTKQGLKSLHLLVEQTDYAQGISKILNSSFTALGGKVTTEEFPSNSSDMRQFVTKAKSSNADAFVVITQTPAAAQRIFKVIQDLKWKTKLFVNDVVPGDPATLKTFKDLLEGAITAEVGTDPNNPVFAHALQVYKEKAGADMPYQSYGQTEWDSLFIIRDGIKAVGYNGEKLAKWLHTSVKDWKGAAGSTTIGSDGDPLSGHRAEVIKNGKVELYSL